MIGEYTELDATGLAALVRDRAVTPQELLESATEIIARREPAVGALAHRFPELGENLAAKGESEGGPFWGVPIVIKDAGLSVAETPLSAGSRLFDRIICDADDTLATRLKAAGFLLIARSKAPEFSLSFTTEPEAFGPVHNPWALDRSAGGSSGGAAAAVAAGLTPLAHASDGAGSIRVPAAHCGLFGFKPSRIRNPLGPRVAEGNAGMGTPHAITRTVRDSAGLLDAISGPDAGDPYAVPAPKRRFFIEAQEDPPPLRIGLVTQPSVAAEISPECREAVLGAAKLCADLGHHIEEAEIGYDGEALKQAWRVVAGVGVAAFTAGRIADLGAQRTRELVEPVNFDWIEEGRHRPATEYLAAVRCLHGTSRSLARFFGHYDILLSPVTAEVAPRLGELAGDGYSLDAFYDRFWAHAPFTAVFNSSGSPAMTVPLHWTEPRSGAPLGLPVGVQFGAAFGADGLLFALAGQLERARPWAARRPPQIIAATERPAGVGAER